MIYTYENQTFDNVSVAIKNIKTTQATVMFDYLIEQPQKVIAKLRGFCENDGETDPEVLAMTYIKNFGILSN
jgi:hypothetical protein